MSTMRIRLIREDTLASTFTLSVTPIGSHPPCDRFNESRLEPADQKLERFCGRKYGTAAKMIGDPVSGRLIRTAQRRLLSGLALREGTETPMGQCISESHHKFKLGGDESRRDGKVLSFGEEVHRFSRDAGCLNVAEMWRRSPNGFIRHMAI
ncbi:hypothetical protein [Rhizobium sp. 007]|uniref:hypothetical protein n=1 Tax=Rhizobium sp. 007 TaxID=2785056 RepID=UPI00188F75D0|nr:hypothetical protein [Rhizobium sp. 007]QPB22154.1 hypothetical protein ISN39_13490 [Rhizobium sp. 007]